MKIQKLTLAALLAVSALFVSCDDSDDPIDAVVNTPDDISTYSFFNGTESTVSFDGQTTRLKMVNEIGDALKPKNDDVTQIVLPELLVLNEMFKDGTGFSVESALDDPKKAVRNKVANSTGLFKDDLEGSEAEKVVFDGYISSQVNDVLPGIKMGTIAASGVAGFVESGKRYVNENGLEYDQAFYKGLIGGLVVDQVLNHYLNRLDDNNDGTDEYRTAHDADETADGKLYTTMEHHWDEAYGYVYGNKDADRLLYKYIKKVDENPKFKGIASTIENAFKLGRAAIVTKNYDERDAQVAVIRKNISQLKKSLSYTDRGKIKCSQMFMFSHF